MSWWPMANQQNDGSDKPVEKWSSNSSPATGVEHVGVKGIKVGKVMNQIFYIANVIIGISLSKPDPVIDKNLVIRKVYAYVQ